jgi:NADH dehydrogenase
MWLGLMWVFEGINKIGEGWLAFASGSKSGWMFSPGVVQAGVKAAEATSGASAWQSAGQAATTAATGAVAATSAASAVASSAAAAAPAATSAASAAAAAPAASGGTEAATKTFKAIWDLTKPIFDPNSGLVTWFRHTFMDGIFAYLPYTVFQTMIVVMEIGIGLALFGGCFTWLAAAASIGMCLVFTLSGMFAWNQLWFVFAAILMLGGLGRSFGIDYWLIPAIKRWWNGTRFARKWHFYADDPTK